VRKIAAHGPQARAQAADRQAQDRVGAEAKASAVRGLRATKVMGEAFDAACRDLHDGGQPSVVYEVIARRIIEAASSGERDPEKLRDRALAAFGRKLG
jgi:hypothetical protein